MRLEAAPLYLIIELVHMSWLLRLKVFHAWLLENDCQDKVN